MRRYRMTGQPAMVAAAMKYLHGLNMTPRDVDYLRYPTNLHRHGMVAQLRYLFGLSKRDVATALDSFINQYFHLRWSKL